MPQYVAVEVELVTTCAHTTFAALGLSRIVEWSAGATHHDQHQQPASCLHTIAGRTQRANVGTHTYETTGEGGLGHTARALHTGPTKDATATTRGSARRLTNTNKSVTGTAEFAAHDKGMHVRYTSPTPVFLGTTASTITHQPSNTQFCCRLHHVECPTIHGMCHQRQRWYYLRHLALAK